MTVPIVSKKSVSMIAKIVRTAANGPRTVKTLVRSNWPSVAKLGVTEIVSGTFAMPVRSATTVMTKIEMIRAPGIFRTNRTIVNTRPRQEQELAGRGREDRGHDRRRRPGAWR